MAKVNQVQIPSKFNVLGNDGLISQPWAYYLTSVSQSIPSGSGYVIDGSAGTTGPTTIYQGPASEKPGTPSTNSIYVADDTGQIFTVSGGQWQEQTPELFGDVTKSAFSDYTTLATVNSTPGVYGNGTNIPVIKVNNKVLVTSIKLIPSQSAPLPGIVGDFPFNADGAGTPGANNLYNTTTYTVSYKLAFHQADATPALICSVPANTVISKVELSILSAFNGTAPTISVGMASGYNDLMATTDNNPGVLSNWSVEPGVEYTSAEDIYVSVNAGSGSAGYALVVVSTVQI